MPPGYTAAAWALSLSVLAGGGLAANAGAPASKAADATARSNCFMFRIVPEKASDAASA